MLNIPKGMIEKKMAITNDLVKIKFNKMNNIESTKNNLLLGVIIENNKKNIVNKVTNDREFVSV